MHRPALAQTSSKEIKATTSTQQFSEITVPVPVMNSSEFTKLKEDTLLLPNVWTGSDRGGKEPPPTPSDEFCFEYTFDKLPDRFPDLQNLVLPLVREIGVRASIEAIAKHFNCEGYRCNYVFFWFLDVIVDCLWMCQDRYSFPEDVQKKVVGWILYAFDLIRGNYC